MKSVAVALVALECVAVSQAARPRGVGPEFAKFYEDTTSFQCITNPAISLPFSRVNDDYCDCPDGSDEPGTAACAHLSSLSPHTLENPPNVTNSLPGFYCKNKGHRPSYVPFSNVNDGICDYELCCDGSEEWDGITKCQDKCAEIGKEWRKHDEARAKSLNAANKKRAELVKEAQRLRKQVEDRLQSLGAQIEAAEIKVKNAEQELKDVQRSEAGKTVKAGPGKGGKLSQLVELARTRMDDLRNNLITSRAELTANRDRLRQLESLLTTFKEEYNPNFNDEGVKRAVRAWEDYAASFTIGAEPNAAQERDIGELVKEDSENGLDWESYVEEESDTDILYSFTSYLPPQSAPSSGSETKIVTEARDRLKAAEKALEDQKKSQTEHTSDLATDFGPGDVFRALKDTCVSKDSGEYTYEFCFWGRTNQKSKKGGGSTNMGSFARIETIYVDEDLPTNGKGLGRGQRIAMKHENGQHCWNGPNRSTTVILACSEENEIWKIMEEEKCVYRVEMGTPSVCGVDVRGPEQAEPEGKKGHDEL
ncbi:Putative mannose-6-phosphate receptor binding domain superfamily, glucosidase II beta subunit [Septoria linicola]|uniref:Glucosidase 2 subunit beta n=1 Tax=Septoria linicola TaxID=215465 RepID=A0A9Q9B0A4_9PEZI|nr:Putative mannose-6-phosphate receptor binding domain superfamily, glucosidase II beta subunit [Septoria linicola]